MLRRVYLLLRNRSATASAVIVTWDNSHGVMGMADGLVAWVRSIAPRALAKPQSVWSAGYIECYQLHCRLRRALVAENIPCYGNLSGTDLIPDNYHNV